MIKRGLNHSNKKADMTAKQIVTIILLIAGFVIILFLLLRFNLSGQIDRTACHQSVILRGTLPEIGKELPTLKCYTRKVCITNKLFGKGDCKEFSGGSFDTIRVLGTDEQIRKKINVFLAREIADCWGMMGEGKTQIFANPLLGSKKCTVCSRIAFEEPLKNKLGNEIKGTTEYLIEHKVPNKEISYWSYITNNLNTIGFESATDKFDMGEKAILFKEMDNHDIATWVGGAGGAGGAAYVTIILIGSYVSAGTLPIAIAFVGGITAIGGVAGYKGGEALDKFFADAKLRGADYMASNALINYEKTQVKGFECSSFESIA